MTYQTIFKKRNFMKRILSSALTATMVVSLSACTTEGKAGKTYTGTITELTTEHIVVSTDDGTVQIPYSEDTEISGFSGMGAMGGMQQPGDTQSGGAPSGDTPSGDASSGDEQTSDEQASDEQSENTESGTPPELPEGESASENGGEAPSDTEGGSQQTSTIEDVTLNSEVSVVVGDDGTAASITKAGNDASGGSTSAPESYDAATEYTEDTEVSGESLSSTEADENAVLVATEGITASLDDVTITRQSDESTGGDNSSFYGIGAAALATNGILSISNSEITTDASGGAGVFAYGDGTAYVSDSTISTQQDTSGGIHVAGGGTLYAWDLNVETSGESAAAIRSDRGSGTMVVDGGSYTSNGVGSPAVYSTADISVHDASLEATGSEAICIEGRNSIRLFDCDLTGNMSDLEQNDCTWNVILYQSMSGDSDEGNSDFEMIGGSLTAKNGGMFYTTNTESTFLLSGVDIENAEDSEFLLKCTGNSNQRGWGSTGSNGADCHFTAIDQTLDGDVIWDSISKLDFYLTQNSTLNGSLTQDESNAGDGGDGYANLYLDDESTWVVTGDSVLTSLSCAGSIVDADGNSVSVVGTDDTVYVEGTSAYTVTVESYSDQADLSDASSPSSWSDYEQTKES